MKGLTQYKKRNGRSNELRNQSANWQNIWNKSRTHTNHYFRRDLSTGETTEITGREFQRMSISDFAVNERIAPYSSKQSVLTEALEEYGAKYFTGNSEFWIEKELINSTGESFAIAKAA